MMMPTKVLSFDFTEFSTNWVSELSQVIHLRNIYFWVLVAPRVPFWGLKFFFLLSIVLFLYLHDWLSYFNVYSIMYSWVYFFSHFYLSYIPCTNVIWSASFYDSHTSTQQAYHSRLVFIYLLVRPPCIQRDFFYLVILSF